MKVTIECRINVDGQWWDLALETHADPNMSPAGKLEYIEKVIRGMAGTNKIISRVGSATPATTATNGQQQPVPEATAKQPGLGWPPPHCEVHREPMKESNQQKKPGHTMFYCPKRLGEGYCGHRASVQIDTGVPKFWEVNQA